MTDEPPFGAYRPAARLRWARCVAAGLPATRAGRLAASLLRSASGARGPGPFDVETFGARTRLYPAENLADKRALLTPQFWDGPERDFLRTRINAARGPFSFVDIGANSGLYTLFARSAAHAAGRGFRGLAVEADPAMAARLDFNLASSGASAETRVLRAAVGARRETVRLLIDPRQRGRTRVSDGDGEETGIAAGAIEVEAAPLADILAAAGMAAPDAMKIDIEGGELGVLVPYFEAATADARPRAIIAELAHDANGALAALLAGAGYRLALRTRLNGAFVRDGQ